MAEMIEHQAASAINSNEYQRTYDLATKGLAIVDQCTNDDDVLLNKAYLLSFKGLAEHSLPEGDSRTDLNQANQLLVECQTNPDFYGTHTAAQCKTQEQYNIQAQTNWDIQQ
jgi:hypothetical protein